MPRRTPEPFFQFERYPVTTMLRSDDFADSIVGHDPIPFSSTYTRSTAPRKQWMGMILIEGRE